jgi:hypothetical protein
MVGPAGFQHLLDHHLVALHALHLVERAFVVAQLQPVHGFENAVDGRLRRAGDIGVFDAQDELVPPWRWA